MKKLLVILLALFHGAALFAQDTTGNATISLAVVMPSEIKDLSDAQMSNLEDRIKDVVTMNGLSAEGGLDGFLIYPKLDINSTKTVQLTLGNMTVVQCTLSLYVRQYIPNSSSILFSSFTRDIAGNGNSEAEAISNALTQIRPDDEAFQAFLARAKTRIIAYYVQNCERIMNEAQHAADLQSYDKAFALLLSIPKEATTCYSQVQQESVAIYMKKQRQDCNRYILEAKTFAAAHNYDSALLTLRKVDPESVCRDELANVLNDVVNRVDDNDKRSWELLIQQLHDNTEIAKARIETEAQMAQGYLNGAGRKSYTVTGNGANPQIQEQQQPAGSMPVQTVSNGSGAPGGAAPVPSALLSATVLKPEVLFDNNIFPSFIISRAGSTISDDQSKYGDIYSCIGLAVNNPSMSGTLTYEIEPVEDKYFEKVTGSIAFTPGQPVVYFPEIPWKYDALKNIQQSTPLSIRFRLIDNGGAYRDVIAKVSVRSISECITSFTMGGKQEISATLAAYVNEENPQIDKILEEGLQKKWVAHWDGYQEGKEGIDRQVKAVWKLLSERGIHYSDITGATTNTSNTFTSQIVRPFCVALADKQANCVEGTILFASILKRIGLRPVMVLKPGHCFLAYRVADDDNGDLQYLETTIIGELKGEPSEKDYEDNYLKALTTGSSEINAAAKNEIYLIDVTASRMQNITPINLSGTCAN
ncbi:MAG TPA: hypothetical protein VL547_04490 [Dinghuibacter sp.]|uniref:hypothetical protein n=1 Tax=Dinghuibacter sp. TaxID=2024697 RepID=UPI002CBB8FA4|nr:hypothetical protein [Dinghuibacter sp.]HTJ11253.1 hypothetical protein [Dinghuibacter sp.]